MLRKMFLFNDDSIDGIRVHKDDLYSPEKEYGFVVEKNKNEQKLLQIPELNSSFAHLYRWAGGEAYEIGEDADGCYIEKEYIPLCFKTDVKRQGNYQVELVIRASCDMHDVYVFEGRRRLVGRAELIKTGETYRCRFTSNVCDIVPRGQNRIYQDTTLDISIVADRAAVSSIEITECRIPTLYIAGDSTVTDQSADYPYMPERSYCGWGQMIGYFLDGDIAVSNHSHSGLTTDSFRKEGHYAIVEQYSMHADYCMFQFGHNDQKLEELKAYGRYTENLTRYIEECRGKGVYPLLVTPVARNSWKGGDGSYNDLLEEYSDAVKELGKRMEVPVVDLHGKSMDFIKKLGLEKAKDYFYPGDYTHTNDYGAYVMAGFVAEELRRICQEAKEHAYRQLAGFVTGTPYIPKVIKKTCVEEKEECFIRVGAAQAEELFGEITEPDRYATRAEALEMLIKAVRFFPVNVYNDRFDDITGHEWYAGTVECALQNGMIPDFMCEGKKFYPEKEMELWEFIVFAVNACKSRKNIKTDKTTVYDKNVPEKAAECVRAAVSSGLIKDSGELIREKITRKKAAEICKEIYKMC